LNPSGAILIEAPDIHLKTELDQLPGEHPFAVLLNSIADQLGVKKLPGIKIYITSTIPLAAGLGSGAAVSVAVARAVSSFLGRPFSDENSSAVAYEVEKCHHGTPSGIDNTVVALGRPVYFRKDQPIEPLRVAQPFTLVIADSGAKSPTSVAVGDVRAAWLANKFRYERIFDAVGQVTELARRAIEHGPLEALGPLMARNQAALQEMGVSTPELELLIDTAQAAGALGAKLSGAGRGGNVIALVPPEQAEKVAAALETAGAVRTIVTTVNPERTS
jgi:mevalonate kinase